MHTVEPIEYGWVLSPVMIMVLVSEKVLNSLHHRIHEIGAIEGVVILHFEIVAVVLGLDTNHG